MRTSNAVHHPVRRHDVCGGPAHASSIRRGAPLAARALQAVPARRRAQRQPFLQVTARGSRQTRLATRITTIPRRVDLYFADRPLRRMLWAAIAFYSGFYCANTVSLSFGALAINDVVAAALTVAFSEVVSATYYSAPKVTLKLLMANCFKIGISAALIADAFKLGG
ncbi:g7919 [Coccomyxa viridis]|uniref:G7919 protein n=1 Tax=Coccomyxa viridis TaxID=1274662 RepID=A0ABP1FZ46_9CHLO